VVGRIVDSMLLVCALSPAVAPAALERRDRSQNTNTYKERGER